jgi:hypothetical protein
VPRGLHPPRPNRHPCKPARPTPASAPLWPRLRSARLPPLLRLSPPHPFPALSLSACVRVEQHQLELGHRWLAADRSVRAAARHAHAVHSTPSPVARARAHQVRPGGRGAAAVAAGQGARQPQGVHALLRRAQGLHHGPEVPLPTQCLSRGGGGGGAARPRRIWGASQTVPGGARKILMKNMFLGMALDNIHTSGDDAAACVCARTHHMARPAAAATAAAVAPAPHAPEGVTVRDARPAGSRAVQLQSPPPPPPPPRSPAPPPPRHRGRNPAARPPRRHSSRARIGRDTRTSGAVSCCFLSFLGARSGSGRS